VSTLLLEDSAWKLSQRRAAAWSILDAICPMPRSEFGDALVGMGFEVTSHFA